MAILQGAIVKIVARHNTPRIGKRGACLHIAVSNGASLFNYFNQPGNPTSHFYVRSTGNTDGMSDFEQYVDTKYQAPANLQGNPTLISLETQGGVGDDLDRPWPATMAKRIAWILAECHRLDGIPLHLMPNSLPASTGVGYHRLGVDPWRVDGGELWSTAYGKVCPGNARIAQVPSIIMRAQQIAGGELDMAIADDILRELRALQGDFNGFQVLYTGRWVQEVEEARAQNKAALDALTQLSEQLAAEEAEEDQFDQLTGQRWAQGIDQATQEFAAAQAKLDALLAAHQPTEPSPPKA